jgi:predicted RNA-binding Zn ribbon-like protein
VNKQTAKQGSEWKDGFLFLANHLALDFINTRPVQNGQATELLPNFAALLRWFEAADLINGGDAAKMQQRWGESGRAGRTLKLARELRERLRNEIFAWQAGAAIRRGTIEELNRLMGKHPMRSRLKKTETGVARERWFEKEEPEDLLGPVADSAATLFAEIDRDRVRKCGGCVLLFYDTSKKGTRRWCSMQLCGNRLKVATYAARHRKQ